MNLRVAPLLTIAATLFAVEASADRVLRIELRNEAITPVTEQFVSGAIRSAGEQGMGAVILILDTPGGLVDSTREIVKAILQSKVPVVVYVAPSGARAASAGTFITMAAHVAAMAPGTTIGAAHPVPVGGLPGLPGEPAPKDKSTDKPNPAEGRASPMEQKVLNDTVSWARSLAELRGRNAEWMARAVKESASVSANEALRENVVDLLADDVDELLQKLQGREVRTASGLVTLRTAGAEVVAVQMWWGQRFLAALANPTLAFLLLIFGIYGIIFELYTPGWGVPGTVGVICLMLGFFSLAILPTNFVGLALVVIALGLLVAEVFVTSYGLLTLGGVICLVTGGLMLMDSPEGFMRVSLLALIPVAAAILAVTLFLMTGVARTQRLPVAMEQVATGALARVEGDFAGADGQYKGFVRVHGELWMATSAAAVLPGQTVAILYREGLLLHVGPVRETPVAKIESVFRRSA